MRSRTLTLLAALVVGAVPLIADTAVAGTAGTGTAPPAFAFSSIRDGGSDSEIFVRRTDGSVRKLTSNGLLEFNPVWSPDGRRIVFVREGGGGGLGLFVMDANGKNVRRLTTPTTPIESPFRTLDAQPAWSPDGRRIAFASDRGTGELTGIWRIDVTGGNLTRLTRPRPANGGGGDTSPAWSPDGRWIWFDSDRATAFESKIFKMRPDGTGARRVTVTPEGISESAPDVSPDGRRVVFVSTRAHDDQFGEFANDLWTMRPDGSDARRLTVDSRTRNEYMPQWTADSKRVLYVPSPQDGIWKINADGTGDRRITIAVVTCGRGPRGRERTFASLGVRGSQVRDLSARQRERAGQGPFRSDPGRLLRCAGKGRGVTRRRRPAPAPGSPAACRGAGCRAARGAAGSPPR
jgi:Tol biopolymer transport system component